MPTSPRRIATIAVLTAGLLVAAGCSSSGGSKANHSSGAPAATGAGGGASTSCTGTPVPFMSFSTLSGGTAEHPEIPDSVQAAAAEINQTCELGRPVKVTVCDDKYNP